jgi:hypothetical protein
MEVRAAAPGLGHLGELLRGEPGTLRDWSSDWDRDRLAVCGVAIVTGAGLYGAAMGLWRSPLAAWFVAIKLPVILCATAAGTALLNAMLAPLLGLNIRFRQSFLAMVLSFTLLSSILGAFSPVLFFVVWNAPLAANSARWDWSYSLVQTIHVVVIAFAGVVANLRLLQLLRQWSGDLRIARRVLIAWLAGNLFFGSQLSWILRPFIGSPVLPVEFFRANAFEGNFYETIFHSFIRLFDMD